MRRVATVGLDYGSYAEAKQRFRFSERWSVFDGGRDRFNITQQCIDRHPEAAEAVRIKFADGRSEVYAFGEMSRLTSQFANFLVKRGIDAGETVALILNPSLEFYVALFGALKRGAVVVPCFPAFGPDAIAYRLAKSGARMVVTDLERTPLMDNPSRPQLVIAGDLLGLLRTHAEAYTATTSADSPAMIQFSSGTTGAPKMVHLRHAAVTFCAVNMKLGAGLRKDDRFFCPSSPAWGHGVWFGTIGPLIFGNAVGAYSGKFRAETLVKALEEFAITNLSATPLVYRMMAECVNRGHYKLKLRDLTYTGGPLDVDTILSLRDYLDRTPRSMYGTTEVGALLLDFPYDDWKVKPGSMGGPALGVDVAVLDEAGRTLPPGATGQIAIRRNGEWARIGDAARVDQDGYFWYKGRVDDVIISAGYTIGALEIEDVLAKHPAVRRAAVVGSPDRERGEIIKAFVIPNRAPCEGLSQEIQEFVRTRLSKHEYPREIEFVDDLPQTPDGKIQRGKLRERERARKEV